jgi:CubicO group peptidase (beta-lactamase class C family)
MRARATSTARSGGLSPARLSRVRELLRRAVARGEIAGGVALVQRRDSVHVEAEGVQDLASGKPMRRDSLFRIASMTKPIVAAGAMALVEEARMRLDDPVERWLPELKDRRVLRKLESELDDTVPAARPITLRDLLTFRFGLGAVMAPPRTFPIQSAMTDLGVAPGPEPMPFRPDEYMARLGRLPLMHQPGERWMYHTGADVTAVLIERVAGVKLADFLAERIFSPLDMKDTGFFVPEAASERFTACYKRDEAAGGLALWDSESAGKFAKAPKFANALVSTADDYLAFCRMLLHHGAGPDGRRSARILARPTVALMMMDHITSGQKAASPFFPGFWDNKGWGFGAAVVTRRDDIAASPGSYAWMGGFGTSFIVDPAEDMVAIFLVQRLMSGPSDTSLNQDFFTLAYQAIDD